MTGVLLASLALGAPLLQSLPIGTDLGTSPTLVHARGGWWAYGCVDGSVHLWESADARTWVAKGAVLVPSTTIDAAGTCPASVLADAGIDGHDWGMWYAAIDADGQERIGLAVSDDGRAWTPRGTAYDCGGGACGSPVAMRVGKYHIWIHTEADGDDVRLRVHHSEDGTTWSTGIPFRLPGGETEIDIAFYEGGYRVLAAGDGGVTLYEGDEVEGRLSTAARLDGCFAATGVALARDPDGITDATGSFIGLTTGDDTRLLLYELDEEAASCDDDTGDTGVAPCTTPDCDPGDTGTAGCPGCASHGAGVPLAGAGAATLLARLARRGRQRSTVPPHAG